MHFGLDYKRKERKVLPSLWERLREFELDGRKIKLLSPEDALFSLALHKRRFGPILSLKNVCDLALVLNKYKHNFNWDYVLKEARNGKMCSTIFFILLQTKIFLDVDSPQCVWRDLSIPFYKRRLIKRFIVKNTFSFSLKRNSKELYLKSHFLLYDSFREPLEYILHIPQEQFAKYYGLQYNTQMTRLLYQRRLLYMPLRYICQKVNKSIL
jgi:hypothetical protein